MVAMTRRAFMFGSMSLVIATGFVNWENKAIAGILPNSQTKSVLQNSDVFYPIYNFYLTGEHKKLSWEEAQDVFDKQCKLMLELFNQKGLLNSDGYLEVYTLFYTSPDFVNNQQIHAILSGQKDERLAKFEEEFLKDCNDIDSVVCLIFILQAVFAYALNDLRKIHNTGGHLHAGLTFPKKFLNSRSLTTILMMS